MVDFVSVGTKGSGLTELEQLDIFEYAEENLRHHKGDYKRIVKGIAESLNKQHKGKWTVFVVETRTTPWELEFYPEEDKFVNFKAHGHQFLIYKSSAE